MKEKGFMIVIVALLGMSLAIPSTGHARRGCCYGWYGPGVFAGGILFGAAIARPWYYAPRPVYVYPAPPVVYAVPPPVYFPNQAYGYPDPALAPKTESGEWVEVPGQSVKGKWVPPHRVWVPR